MRLPFSAVVVPLVLIGNLLPLPTAGVGPPAAGTAPFAEGLGSARESSCQTPPADWLLCDDFESTEIDPSLWGIQAASGNEVELDSNHSAGGDQSVHLRVKGGKAYLEARGIFPLAANRYWARLYLRVARWSTVPWAHWTVAEAAGAGDGSLIRVGGQYVTDLGEVRWGVGSDGGPTGDWTLHTRDPGGSPVEPPVDTWLCLEWLHDGERHQSRFFVDGDEHPSLATTAEQHGGVDVPYRMPTFSSLWFGWWQYQEDPAPLDVWIDSVVVASERVGCGT